MTTVHIENTTADGPHGPVPLRLYVPAPGTGTELEPESAAEPGSRVGLVWLHGGGFHGGDLDVPEAHWVSSLLAEAGITVVSAHYRLAEGGVHFPVMSDDVLAAWRWATSAAHLGVEPGSWHLGGGSAGGNLAASVALQLRDAGGVLPRSSLLVYPVLHDVLPPAPDDLLKRVEGAPGELRFPPEKCREANLNYVGDERLLTHPYAFPARANLVGLPPTLIVPSDLDELRPSGEAYAAALALAGVDVTLVREVGTWHGHLNEFTTAPARRTVNRMIAWLRQADLGGEPHVPADEAAPLPPLPDWVLQAGADVEAAS